MVLSAENGVHVQCARLARSYPQVHRLLSNTAAEANLRVGVQVRLCADSDRAFYNAVEQGRSTVRPVCLDLIGQSMTRYGNPRIDHLEADLKALASIAADDRLRDVYQKKLLLESCSQYLDALYEVAVAAIVSRFGDPGTIELEKPIPERAYNSDVACSRDGHPFRFEVTVFHVDRPPLARAADKPECYTRSIMDPHERQQLPDNPPGTITLADLPHDSKRHSTTPWSTTILQRLADKRRQCADGEHNVLVIGVTCSYLPEETRSALFGSPFASVPIAQDGRCGDTTACPTTTAPFINALRSSDRAQFIDPFRIISAVWLLGLNANTAQSTLLLNPNASCPLSLRCVNDLEALGSARAHIQIQGACT